ncbi:hypothetical protein BKA57DRAFT_376671, partial [Linnemannia elongata]
STHRQECYNCGVTKTPLWRRTADRLHSLCNACGLYYKQYKTNRPLQQRQQTLKQQLAHQRRQLKQKQQPSTTNLNAVTTTTSITIECANCGQTETPLWRKDAKGQSICNACGLYSRLHQRDRPVTMRKSNIAR